MTDFFTENASKAYDQKNHALAPIAENMHFLIRLVLKDLPARARILCVGVGTGAEILSLAKNHPEWRFVGVDPSAAMLAVCSERLKDAHLSDRCELVHGYVQDVAPEEDFDAVLSVLVGHFIEQSERLDFYRNMQQRLKAGGYFINTEISFDLEAPEFPAMLENWKSVQALMGATPDNLGNLAETLRDHLSILSPAMVKDLIRVSGIAMPVKFFQAFMISGWYGQKDPVSLSR